MKKEYVKSLVLLVLAAAVATICYLSPAAKTSSETDVVLYLPKTFSGMESIAITPSEHEKKSLPTNTSHIKRSYFPIGQSERSYNAIAVSLIISGGDDRSLHRPQVCLDGQGWSIPYYEEKTLEIEGKELPVMDLYLSREVNGQILEAHYYFCWIGKGISTPSYAKMRWISLVDNFSKNLNHRWAYPGVFAVVNPYVENPQEDVWKRASYVIKNITPHFYKKFGATENK